MVAVAAGAPALEQGAMAELPPRYLLVWKEQPQPSLVVCFDGCSGNLAYFLSQMWH